MADMATPLRFVVKLLWLSAKTERASYSSNDGIGETGGDTGEAVNRQ
jgi:hypothetical protein